MRLAALALLALLVLPACSSILTPTIDQHTGTTLAQRCVDYRATVAASELILAERELSGAERSAYDLAKLFVAANCPAPPPPAPPAAVVSLEVLS